jgi:hypothetical protein
MRLPIPSGDVIIRLVASYNDGAERAVAFHWVLKDGYRLSDKRIRFPVPSGSDIAAHPGMALIPSTRWIAGSDTSLRERDAPFWIDIRPPTVIEYSRIARQLLRAGAIDRDNSFILRAQEDSAALTKTGLDKVRALGESLGGILNAIAQSSGRDVSAPGDIVVGQTKLPCATCPAPMTRFEAKAYCRFRGMWLPVARQWELAARGVDGRTFPWGDRSDTSRANIPGLPATVGSSIGLKPVDAYRDQRSPFGLYDTVGNAGDWVENDVSSYERVYMGATYQFNPEDATTFRMLPVTDADFAVREITARCIAPAGPPIR